MYKLLESISGEINAVMLDDCKSIPFDPANTDYANFKREILADKAQLQDADGNVMTAEAAKEFVRGLP